MSRKTTPTYVLLNQITLAATSSSVTFSNIPQNYGDLVLTWNGSVETVDRFMALQFNGDSSSTYTAVWVANTSMGTRSATATDVYYGGGERASAILNIMDYTATDKHKTTLIRSGGTDYVQMRAMRYPVTSPITSIRLFTTTTSFGASSNFSIGSTFSLYGLVA